MEEFDPMVKIKAEMVKDEESDESLLNSSFAKLSQEDKNDKRLPEFRQLNSVCPNFWRQVENGLRLEGKHFCTGQFTGSENQQLKSNWMKLIKSCPFESPEVLLRKNVNPSIAKEVRSYVRERKFYTRLGHKINRSPYSVYVRARKMFNISDKSGKFTEEEIETLKKLESLHGTKWENIGKGMGRSGHSVYHKALKMEKDIRRGTWTEEEERDLKSAVARYLKEKGENASQFSRISWVKVANDVPTRNAKQCRERWAILPMGNESQSDDETKFSKSNKRKNRPFSRGNKVKLIKVLLNFGGELEYQVDWTKIFKHFSGVPSPQYLQLKWSRIKRMIKNYKMKSFKRVLKAALEILSSSDSVVDSNPDDDDDDDTEIKKTKEEEHSDEFIDSNLDDDDDDTEINTKEEEHSDEFTSPVKCERSTDYFEIPDTPLKTPIKKEMRVLSNDKDLYSMCQTPEQSISRN